MAHISMYQQYLILHIDLQLTILFIQNYQLFSIHCQAMNFLCLKPSRIECLPTQTTTKKLCKQTLKIQNETS